MIKNYVEAMNALTDIESFIDHVVNENARLRVEISDLKTEVGRLEALLADKKSESDCECDYNCECCKYRDEAFVDALADAMGVKPDKIRKITICPFNSPNENTERVTKEDSCGDEADEEHEPTLKDLYELGKYLVDTVDEIESIHIQVVRTRKKEDDDEE